tara:strand:- start:71 stop:634 length:564 start_codon:yes stop_codon:yes gene_type:complete
MAQAQLTEALAPVKAQLESLSKKLDNIHQAQAHPAATATAAANAVEAADIPTKHKATIAKALKAAYEGLFVTRECEHLFSHDYKLFMFLRTLTPDMLQETTRKEVRNNNFGNFLLISYPDFLAQFERLQNLAKEQIEHAEEEAATLAPAPANSASGVAALAVAASDVAASGVGNLDALPDFNETIMY